MKIRKLFLLSAISISTLLSCNNGPHYIDINNIEDFKNMKCDGFYRLKNDLDFNNAKITPIGSREVPFSGQFIGDGHSITNYIFDDENVGLFNYVTGKIDNLKVNANISAINVESTSVGLLANCVDGATITNCSATGNINVTATNLEIGSYVGGLIGYAKKSTINKCHASVNIVASATASMCVGGLIGYNGGEKALESNVSNCYVENAGIVVNTNNDNASLYAGGLVGKNYGTISKCLTHHSNISGDSKDANNYIGGVVGDNNDGLVDNCLGAANVTSNAKGRTFIGLVLGRTFSSDVYKEHGITRNNYGASTSIINISSVDVEQMNTNIAYLDDMKNANWYRETLDMKDFHFQDGHFPSLDDNFVAIDMAARKGSAENPIEISTAAGLMNIEMDKSYRMIADIDLNGVNFIPLGEYQNPYRGVFDGNNKTIKNFLLDSLPSIQGVGIFGFLNGVVKNLKINANIQGSTNDLRYVGALAGNAIKSFIYGCQANIKIHVATESLIFGGLIGYAELCTIYHCSANGTDINLSSTTNSAVYGGLIGKIVSSHLYECFSDVKIIVNIATSFSNKVTVGGLIGFSDSLVYDVYSHCEINLNNQGEAYEAGLIANNHRGKLYNAYTKANLLCSDYRKLVGGLAGFNDGEITNCYYRVNDEVKYSCGTSIKIVKATRVDENGLKGLANKISPAFYDDKDNTPHLNFEKRGAIL